MGGFGGEKGVKHNSFNSNVSMNSMIKNPNPKSRSKNVKDIRFWNKLYDKHDAALEKIMVSMKYESNLTNKQIKDEVMDMVLFNLKDFFERAK